MNHSWKIYYTYFDKLLLTDKTWLGCPHTNHFWCSRAFKWTAQCWQLGDTEVLPTAVGGRGRHPQAPQVKPLVKEQKESWNSQGTKHSICSPKLRLRTEVQSQFCGPSLFLSFLCMISKWMPTDTVFLFILVQEPEENWTCL